MVAYNTSENNIKIGNMPHADILLQRKLLEKALSLVLIIMLLLLEIQIITIIIIYKYDTKTIFLSF